MDQIRPWLYIGKYRDTLAVDHLRAKNIGAMLQLAEHVEQPDIITLYLPVEDLAPVSNDHIRGGVDFIRNQKQKGIIVLVACGAGINRSSAFCTAVLKEEEGLGLLSAYKVVKKRHPQSMPHEPVWTSLCNYYGEEIPYLDVMRISA